MAVSANHIKKLTQLANYLDDAGWDVVSQAPDQTNPYHRLILKITPEDDYSKVLWNIELSYLPISENDLVDVSILQCFIALADNFEQLLKPQLYEIITRLNVKMPLVGFGFTDDFNTLYYKHNMMLPDNNNDANGLQVSESLSMIVYLVSTFTELIFEVANGKKTVAETISELKQKGLYS